LEESEAKPFNEPGEKDDVPGDETIRHSPLKKSCILPVPASLTSSRTFSFSQTTGLQFFFLKLNGTKLGAIYGNFWVILNTGYHEKSSSRFLHVR
jgi:hypothetical protein